MPLVGWFQRQIRRPGEWGRRQRHDLISQFARDAAGQFQPEIQEVIRQARRAARYGIAGFVVGLLAVLITVVLALIVFLS